MPPPSAVFITTNRKLTTWPSLHETLQWIDAGLLSRKGKSLGLKLRFETGLKLSSAFISGVTLGRNSNASSSLHWLNAVTPGIHSGLVPGFPTNTKIQVTYIKWCRTMQTARPLYPWIPSLGSKTVFWALPISGLRWPLKMVRYSLDPQNPKDHVNREVQIFIFILRTLVKLSRPSRVCIAEKPPST